MAQHGLPTRTPFRTGRPRNHDPAKVRALGRLDLFATCSPRDLKVISRHTDIVDPPSGALLAREGRPASEVIGVVDGTVPIYKGRILRGSVPRGGCIGAVEALTLANHNHTYRAGNAVRLAVIDARLFRSLADSVPGLSAMAHRPLRGLGRVRQNPINLVIR